MYPLVSARRAGQVGIRCQRAIQREKFNNPNPIPPDPTEPDSDCLGNIAENIYRFPSGGLTISVQVGEAARQARPVRLVARRLPSLLYYRPQQNGNLVFGMESIWSVNSFVVSITRK